MVTGLWELRGLACALGRGSSLVGMAVASRVAGCVLAELTGGACCHKELPCAWIGSLPVVRGVFLGPGAGSKNNISQASRDERSPALSSGSLLVVAARSAAHARETCCAECQKKK